MKRIAPLLISAGALLWALPAKAVCPVCTVAVAGGLGLSRWLGIDDTITGLWAGALVASVTFWTINWLNKKNIKFYGRKILVAIFWYGLTFVPLYYMGITGHPYNKLWGMDKFVLGVIIGSIVFAIASKIYDYIKEKNHGKAHFPYEKVVIPVVALAVLSAIFYFITR
ncbi:MAG: hypothetical protein NTW66_04395 [Candidatus Magasanikbacteria bacterium]|nr:hypothetical protein [Candidatus Magasanikbacteria bacterium]